MARGKTRNGDFSTTPCCLMSSARSCLANEFESALGREALLVSSFFKRSSACIGTLLKRFHHRALLFLRKRRIRLPGGFAYWSRSIYGKDVCDDSDDNKHSGQLCDNDRITGKPLHALVECRHTVKYSVSACALACTWSRWMCITALARRGANFFRFRLHCHRGIRTA